MSTMSTATLARCENRHCYVLEVELNNFCGPSLIPTAPSFGPNQQPWLNAAPGLLSFQNVPSAARVAAGAFGFLTLIHAFDLPER